MFNFAKERPAALHVRVLLWGAVVVWAAVIFTGSSRTPDGLGSDFGPLSQAYLALMAWSDQVFGPGSEVIFFAAHGVAYLILGALLMAALSASFTVCASSSWAVMLASLYGITDELHQYFVPRRSCDPLDWLVDTCGAFVGVVIVRLILRIWNERVGRSSCEEGSSCSR